MRVPLAVIEWHVHGTTRSGAIRMRLALDGSTAATGPSRIVILDAAHRGARLCRTGSLARLRLTQTVKGQGRSAHP